LSTETTIVRCVTGDADYHRLLGPVADNKELRDEIWRHAEIDMRWATQKTWIGAKTWWVAVHDGAAAAWVAARLDPDLRGWTRCESGYEMPGTGREQNLHRAAFLARHAELELTDCVTFIFVEDEQPKDLYLKYGWTPGLSAEDTGWSDEIGVPAHHWRRFTRYAMRTPRYPTEIRPLPGR